MIRIDGWKNGSKSEIDTLNIARQLLCVKAICGNRLQDKYYVWGRIVHHRWHLSVHRGGGDGEGQVGNIKCIMG